ncbi:MAG: hypothetical protein U0232_11260 [Thermomicrobiales bacterium]
MAFAIPLSFFLIGYRLDMVDKEIWYIVPALAVCAGVACDWIISFWQGRQNADQQQATVMGRLRGLLQRYPITPTLIGIYLAHLTWGGITLWIFRIMVTRH